MHAAGLRMFRGSHLAALPCLQRLGSAAAFARGLTTGAYGRRVYLVPGIKRIAANMSSTSSQRGYPVRRGSAANMSTTSSQRGGYPAQRSGANMSSTSSQRGYPARKSEPWTRFTHQERRPQWVAYNPRTMRPPPLSTDTNSMKILSWNVNGLQTMVQSGFSADELVGRENFDVLCLQETHLEERNVDLFKNLVPEYDYTYWSCSVARLGYSGTAVISRVQPILVQYGLGIPEHDQEGRLITLEFDDFYLVNAYIPNSGRGLRRLNYRVNDWDPCFSDFIKKLECSKPVIVAGDLNCARESIDIHNPQAKTEAAGFTIEERESFEENFTSKGLIDTFRKQHPNAVAYTFWGENQRITNKGWRLDYFLASESIADKVHDSYTLPDVSLSDHSPIGLVLKL